MPVEMRLGRPLYTELIWLEFAQEDPAKFAQQALASVTEQSVLRHSVRPRRIKKSPQAHKFISERTSLHTNKQITVPKRASVTCVRVWGGA